jgi:uncharacterized RDD family membrane protein YckC
MNLSVFHKFSDSNQQMRQASLRERIIAQLIDGAILGISTSVLLLLFSRGKLYAVWISPMLPVYLLQITEGYLPYYSDWWWGGYYASFSLPYIAELNIAFPAPLQLFYYAVYYCYFHSQFGQTPGKMMKGLVLLDDSGRLPSLRISMVRWIGYLLSFLPLGIGFWVYSSQKNRRTWHDHFAGTDVYCFMYNTE